METPGEAMNAARWLSLLAFPVSLAAQQPTVALSVRVIDSSSAPLASAEVSVVRGLSGELARGATNAAGRVTLMVPRGDSALQLTARKIGYSRGYRFFSTAGNDSLSVEIRLGRAVTTLAPVVVSEREDLRRKSYHLTAEDIENSRRPVLDGSDIFKLRPDMMNSRGGAKACEVPQTPRTGWIESVWVNGQRVMLPVVDPEYVEGRKAALGIPVKPPRPMTPAQAERGRGAMTAAFPSYGHIDSVLSVLRLIKPEHIEEITYHDCFDGSVGKNNSDLAMFIVLKPGVGFSNGIGSYVMPRESSPRRAQAAPDPLGVDTLPRFRFRVLGVFDPATGDPLEGVDIIDVRGGNRTRTSATGTVSLFFVPEGTSLLKLTRDGYRDTTLTVSISPGDTLPLTFLMTRKP